MSFHSGSVAALHGGAVIQQDISFIKKEYPWPKVGFQRKASDGLVWDELEGIFPPIRVIDQWRACQKFCAFVLKTSPHPKSQGLVVPDIIGEVCQVNGKTVANAWGEYNR
jgi:hypothetical protein